MINKIGLFGTCGKSSWREEFIEKYKEYDIAYFNPQLPEGAWHPGCVKDENDNLMQNGVVLFPILAETTAQGSLAVVGFSVSAALKRNPDRYFIFLIDDNCTDPNASEDAIKDSIRSRTLVKSKLIELKHKNSGIFVVQNLSQMLTLSIQLHAMFESFTNIRTKYK